MAEFLSVVKILLENSGRRFKTTIIFSKFILLFIQNKKNNDILRKYAFNRF